jgi:hypothetical protein
MKRVYNLIVLCILLICQQNIVAQSYNLGRQKQSFAYETLYAKHPQKSQVEKSQVENSQVVKSNNEMVNTQPAQPLASPEDIQKCEQMHKQIVKLSQHYTGSRAFNKYNGIYKSLSETQENILNLQKIQYVVISYLNSQGEVFPQIEKQLKNASSMEEEIAVFLSYYKEQ